MPREFGVYRKIYHPLYRGVGSRTAFHFTMFNIESPPEYRLREDRPTGTWEWVSSTQSASGVWCVVFVCTGVVPALTPDDIRSNETGQIVLSVANAVQLPNLELDVVYIESR